MKAVIVGAGEVGFHLADRLSKEGHAVALIDQDTDRKQHLEDRINANVVVGSGASAEVLEKAGIEGAELFIAVTDVDEVNMVASMLASEYKVPHKIARVKSAEYTHSSGRLNAEKLGIELLINPQIVVANEICQTVAYADAVEVAEFAEGRVVFIGYLISKESPLVGKSFKELAWTKSQTRMVATSITRKEQTIIPSGSDVIEEGDVVSVVCTKADLQGVRSIFGYKGKEVKNIFILGAGHVGYEVARRLTDTHKVKVVDRNQRHCEELADKLEEVLVLCTDSTDVETLRSEGISKSDAFVAVTDDDQSNILGSLLAKKHGARRAVCLVNQPELLKLGTSLGIEACISPRLATASAILKYIRRGNVVSMVEQSDAEVLEIQLPSKSDVLNQPLHSISVPGGAIIGAIVRGKEVVIPGGNDVLLADDRVIVFTLLDSVPKVESFFS